MAKITIDQFKGAATGVTPRLIPAGFAQSTLDADLRLRTLRGIRNAQSTGINTGISNPATVFRYRDQHWMAWSTDVDVVRSPLPNDQYARIYWTGDGAPKMAAVDSATVGLPPYPSSSVDLGVPPPPAPVTVSPSGGEEPTTVVTAFYTHTYVTEYGEEGPPSPPSLAVQRWDIDGQGNGYVDVGIPAINAGARNITKVRIYRSEFGGDFNFVDEVIAGTANYRDSVPSEQLLTPLESTEWDVPPETMQGLIHGPSRSLVGFFDNVVCFSESGFPHAWPARYQIPLADDVVGIARSAAGIVVATRGKPVLLVGSTPESIAPLEIDTDQACLAKRSVVDMGSFAVYASPDGLVAIGPEGSRLLTDTLLEREAWQQLNPYSFNAYRESDRYLAFYTDKSGTSKTLAFSPSRGFEFMSGHYSAAYYDKYDDALYVANGSTLDIFDRGATRKPFLWRSGIFEVQPGTTFSCGKLIAASYPLTLRMYAAGVQQFEITVPSPRPFRLPPASADPLIREWEIELAGSHEVFSLQIAQSMSELV